MSDDLWPQEIWLCQSPTCGLRFPARQGEPRAASCPLCEAQTQLLEVFERPPAEQEAVAEDHNSLMIVLDNIRSANNVGSMIRTADAVQASVALCGFTATPENPKVKKTSLGAHDNLEWSCHRNGLDFVTSLQADGWSVWAVESTPQSLPLGELGVPPGRLALVVGNEVSGVDPGILRIADAQVHLPMGGSKTSLNVAVAMGAMAYAVRASQ